MSNLHVSTPPRLIRQQSEQPDAGGFNAAGMGFDSSSSSNTSKTIKVTLRRGTKGFGFSIRGGWEFDRMPLYVLRIADDGPAAMDGRLRVGDQLLEINGRPCGSGGGDGITAGDEGMSHEEAIQLIKERDTVQLVVKRVGGED